MNSGTPPRALLLDFGSVISVSPFERQGANERLLGLPSGSLAWFGPLDPAGDPLWMSMQRDEISERDYWAARAAQTGDALGEPGWNALTFFTRTRALDPNESVRPEIGRLVAATRAAGLRVGVLSNEFELFCGAGMRARIDVLRDMDAFVDATHTRILKPDPRAFALGVEALGCPVGEVLFVDDQFRNVAGAARAGLQTQFFDLRDVAGNVAALAARLRLGAML